MDDSECRKGYFQQDDGTAYAARVFVQRAQSVFEDRAISLELWTPRRYLKQKIYINNRHTLEELESNIRLQICAIEKQMLQQDCCQFPLSRSSVLTEECILL